jgi:hypothetical protein
MPCFYFDVFACCAINRVPLWELNNHFTYPDFDQEGRANMNQK